MISYLDQQVGELVQKLKDIENMKILLLFFQVIMAQLILSM